MLERVITKTVVKITETPLAILVNLNGHETWLPKSEVTVIKSYNSPTSLDTLIKVEIPEWLYDKL